MGLLPIYNLGGYHLVGNNITNQLKQNEYPLQHDFLQLFDVNLGFDMMYIYIQYIERESAYVCRRFFGQLLGDLCIVVQTEAALMLIEPFLRSCWLYQVV